MRIDSFELLRYGHFSDRELVFPRNEHDFHLIYGPNEAGKSTLRQAFHDLLFGIPLKTPMAFLHPGPDLALNAVISSNGESLAMGRRRKAKGGLVDGTGNPLPVETFAHWLGDVTPAFHERMFGLDHRRLEQGSRAMLQAGDDVDSVLFQAAAGVAALKRVLDALRDEADSLWAPRASRQRAWYEAHERFKEAEKALKAATVRPTAWVSLQRDSQRADQALQAARERCAQLQSRIGELERLRRVAPILVQLRELEARLQQLEEGGESPLLAFEAELLALEEMRVRVAGHPGELAQCATRMRMLQEELADVLRQLGRAEFQSGQLPLLDVVAADLPARPLRQEIRQLLQEGGELERAREDAAGALEAKRTEIEAARSRIAALPEGAVGPALRQALNAATAAGDLEAALQNLRRRARQEEAELLQRLRALRQPGLQIDMLRDIDAAAPDTHRALSWLEAMQPFSTIELAEYVQRRQSLLSEQDAAETRLAEAVRQLNDARLRLEQFRRTHQAASWEEVLSARRDRDALWGLLASGERTLDEEAERFSALVKAADLLVDQHLQAVGDAAQRQSLEHECEREELRVQGLQQARDQLADRLEVFEEHWEEQCGRRGLPLLSPSALQAWQSQRETALNAARRLQFTREEMEEAVLQRERLLRDLGAAWRADPATNGEALEVSDLAQACERVRQRLKEVEETQARRAALREQLERLEALLPMLGEECRRAEAACLQNRQRREAALLRAGLPAAAEDGYVESALELLEEADHLLAQMRDRDAERLRLQTDLQQFTSRVLTLAGRLSKQGISPEQAEEYVRLQVAELAPLRAAQRELEQLTRQLAALRAQLLEAGEGRDRAQLEAELAQADLSSLAVEIQTLQEQLDEAGHERDRLAVERQSALAALQAVSGGDAAAQAAARRQEALADMAEIAEHFVRVHAQARLLEQVTEQYRERSQGPLLKHAGSLFGRLTLGAYTDLVVDDAGASLQARRSDGRLVALEGLSDGTRDQLYLALRLAALELYLDNARPMPFIADDLFINYDDSRTLAGLRELCNVSRRTQVVFLTHHAHMVELAREHLAERLHIIEL